ncbi:MAG: phage replisome organizer N-terminal domain-containing protein [Bacillota bacterium]
MKSRNSGYQWIPLWIDKWIFGSTRIECSLEERAIWIDFLALAAKDDGYIRANHTTPYALEQLAGLLLIPFDILKTAIETFIRTDKLEENMISGIYRIKNWELYQLSNVHKRVIKHRLLKKQSVTDSVTPVTSSVNIDKIRKEYIRKEKNIREEESMRGETKKFIKPSLEEVKAYCNERKNNVDPQRWYDYYSANGWKVGKNPMKDWKAAVRTWEKSEEERKERSTKYI